MERSQYDGRLQKKRSIRQIVRTGLQHEYIPGEVLNSLWFRAPVISDRRVLLQCGADCTNLLEKLERVPDEDAKDLAEPGADGALSLVAHESRPAAPLRWFIARSCVRG